MDDKERRCPRCGTPVETREAFDRHQNTRLQPCGCIVSAADFERLSTETDQDGGQR